MQIEPSPMTFAQIEAYAGEVATRLKFHREHESVRDLAKRLGGKLYNATHGGMDRLETASLVIRGPGDFDIWFSPITGMLRDNWVVGHELGHYFLHSGEPPGTVPITLGRYGVERIEQQANRFAAGLLLPRAQFIEIAQRTGNNITILAGRFSVCMAAVQIRLESLRKEGALP